MKLEELLKETTRRFNFEFNEATIGNKDTEGALINFEYVSSTHPRVTMNHAKYVLAGEVEDSSFGEIFFNFEHPEVAGRSYEFHLGDDLDAKEVNSLYRDIKKYGRG